MDSRPHYVSCNINKFDMTLSNSFFDCRIYWARIVSSENESLFTKYQKHSFYEIQYALQGKIGFTFEEDAYSCIQESEFLIVPPDTYHQIIDSDISGARFIMGFYPVFRDPAMQEAFTSLNFLLPYPESPHMRGLLATILQKEFHDEALRKESIKTLVECFLLEVMEIVTASMTHTAEKPENLTKTEEEVRRMLAFIHDYNGIGISVSDIAKRFTVSERQLTRMFTEVTNASPSAAIAAEKLKKIEELIASTPLSFIEIAEICGFSDGYAMNKFFKRHNHVNLSDFRAISGKKEP